jgi:hypothetical protein
VFCSDIAEGDTMMNVNEARTQVPVHIAHCDFTDAALKSVVTQACATRLGITLVSIKDDGLNSTLQEVRLGLAIGRSVANVVSGIAWLACFLGGLPRQADIAL